MERINNSTFGAASSDGLLVDGGLVTVAVSRTAVAAIITIILTSSAWVDQRRLAITQRLIKF